MHLTGSSEWAATQDNLGIAYQRRIRGERSENLERGIKALEAGLTVSSPIRVRMTGHARSIILQLHMYDAFGESVPTI